MHKNKDRFDRFLSRTHIVETCTTNQRQQVDYDTYIREIIVEFGELSQGGSEFLIFLEEEE